jgi:hypothetical protein
VIPLFSKMNTSCPSVPTRRTGFHEAGEEDTNMKMRQPLGNQNDGKRNNDKNDKNDAIQNYGFISRNW